MPHKDLSMIALVFFLTRCFFNLYTFVNVFSFIIGIVILKKINIKFKKIIKWLYIICMIFVFATILINAINFININYFRFENYLSIGISLIVISYLIGNKDIKTISSMSEILLFIFIIIVVLIYISILSLIKLNNYNDFLSINNICISISPYMLLVVLVYIRKNNIITGYILGVSSIFIDTILLIGSLGTKLPLSYTYPSISILKTITFFHFINHLDKLFSFIYLFEYTITLALIFNVLYQEIKKEGNI